MLVLRFKGPDYIKQLDKSLTDDFRFLKQPHTKISKNMKKELNSLIIYLKNFLNYIIIYKIYKN